MPKNDTPTEIRRSLAGDKAFEDAAAILGKRLVKHRKRLGLTQERAAERIGIHEVTLREIEHGRMNITLATLVALAMAYEIRLHNLFLRQS